MYKCRFCLENLKEDDIYTIKDKFGNRVVMGKCEKCNLSGIAIAVLNVNARKFEVREEGSKICLVDRLKDVMYVIDKKLVEDLYTSANKEGGAK